tara:strand:+ start:429 stop:836 length:408 start_codon:yes stop_codon:yes gene_type:complete
MKITKRQLKQIIQEELTAVIKEGYAEDFGKGVGYVTDKVVNAPAKIGRVVKKVGSDILSGFDSQTDVRVPASDRKKRVYLHPPSDTEGWEGSDQGIDYESSGMTRPETKDEDEEIMNFPKGQTGPFTIDGKFVGP